MSLRWLLLAVVAGARCADTCTVGRSGRRSGPVGSTLAALEEQILEAPAPRTAEQVEET